LHTSDLAAYSFPKIVIKKDIVQEKKENDPASAFIDLHISRLYMVSRSDV
jgi:hypothetical protein